MRCALNSSALLLALFVNGAAAESERLDAAHTVVLDQTAEEIRLFVVSRETNRELLPLDAFPARDATASPRLEVIAPNSAYLHFYSDYGIYKGSVKYIFDLSGAKPPVKIRYGTLALTSVVRRNDQLDYSASFDQPGQIFQDGWHEQHAAILVEPRRAGLPAYQIVEGAIPAGQSASQPAALSGTGGEAVLVENTTPPGQPHRPSAIFVDHQPFPAP
ncbi:MAG TPA: hypothetical protein VGS58_09620, partial [Candidatus Sulfopaludibacter sp.]|nr:hypothetical protein [Candidatus Sulfopaludibacter sp.]